MGLHRSPEKIDVQEDPADHQDYRWAYLIANSYILKGFFFHTYDEYLKKLWKPKSIYPNLFGCRCCLAEGLFKPEKGSQVFSCGYDLLMDIISSYSVVLSLRLKKKKISPENELSFTIDIDNTLTLTTHWQLTLTTHESQCLRGIFKKTLMNEGINVLLKPTENLRHL